MCSLVKSVLLQVELYVVPHLMGKVVFNLLHLTLYISKTCTRCIVVYVKKTTISQYNANEFL